MKSGEGRVYAGFCAGEPVPGAGGSDALFPPDTVMGCFDAGCFGSSPLILHPDDTSIHGQAVECTAYQVRERIDRVESLFLERRPYGPVQP